VRTSFALLPCQVGLERSLKCLSNELIGASCESSIPFAYVKTALCYFVLVFGAGFLLAAVRVPFLVPRLGVRMAELIEMPLMFLVIVYAAGYVARRFTLRPALWVCLMTGVLALLFLVSFELLLAYAMSGHSVAAYIASRDPVSGSVYLAMLGVYALMPWLYAVARVERPTRQLSQSTVAGLPVRILMHGVDERCRP
jgi:hypothetical protein